MEDFVKSKYGMNEFKAYHPIVNFIYFVLVIGFSMFFMHPLCLFISLVCAFLYSVILKGKKAIKDNLIYMIPMMLAMIFINPLFNHEGVTILKYLPGGNPLTLESVLYGVFASVMIAGVICWFSCYNAVMTSDKFMYLFGRVIPSLSMIFSMTLRFVPKFSAQLKTVANAQKCIGRDVSNGSIIKRAKHGLSILSVMVTWALESSVETADSMKSRGYGVDKRTAFSIYTFDKRDAIVLLYILFFGIYVFVGRLMGEMYFRYFPYMEGTEFSLFGMSVFISYIALCILPVVIEIWEVGRWKTIKSKI